MQQKFKLLIAFVLVFGIQISIAKAQNFSTAGFYEVENGNRKVYIV